MSAAIKHLVPDHVMPSFVIFYIWALLTLSPERQSARLSKITNDGLTPCGTACFIAGNSGRQRVINGSGENRRVTV